MPGARGRGGRYCTNSNTPKRNLARSDRSQLGGDVVQPRVLSIVCDRIVVVKVLGYQPLFGHGTGLSALAVRGPESIRQESELTVVFREESADCAVQLGIAARRVDDVAEGGDSGLAVGVGFIGLVRDEESLVRTRPVM